MKSAARNRKRQTFPLEFQRLSIQYIEKNYWIQKWRQ